MGQSVAIRGERGSYNVQASLTTHGTECSYPG
jgi:hypothetical protein